MTLTAPDTDTITKAIALASRAPSVHNSQPWRWRYDQTGLRLYANPYSAIPVTDAGGRELILSCGVTLHHLEVAMAGLGFKSLIERFPNPNDHSLLARVEFSQTVFVTDAQRARLDAIERRYSDRLPLKPPPGWEAFEAVLRHNLGDAVTLTVVPEDARSALESASSLVESIRRYDSRYHAELHWWTGHTYGAQGVPAELLPSQEETARVPVGRVFPRHEQVERRTDVPEDRSTVVILSTDTDSSSDVLRAGEALSVVLLEATIAGYATCPLTHLVELPGSRGVVQKLVDGNLLPQVLVRIGAAPTTGAPAAATPRLDVSKILDLRI